MAQTPEKPATVEGKVTNSMSSEPILRAHVTLRKTGGGSQQTYGTLAEADGKYSITNLPAGEYVLSAERIGFVNSASQSIAAVTVRVAAGDSRTEQNVKLIPQGAITGRVLTPDGEPMEGVMVSAMAGSLTASSPQGTDDKGNFRIGGLSPGKYRVQVRPVNLPMAPEIRSDGTSEVHYSRTYYPGVPSEKLATRVEVLPGADTNGIEIHPLRTPIVKVSGVVTGIPEKAENVNVMASLPDGGGYIGNGRVKPDGTFEIWHLDAGKYKLTANRREGSRMWQSAPTDVEVGATHLENVELRIVPAATFTGQIEYDDDGAKPPVPKRDAKQDSKTPTRPSVQQIFLRPFTGFGGNKMAQISPDGAFTFEDIQPDQYRVSISWSPAFVKSIGANGKETDGAILDLRNGAGNGAFAIRISSKAGELSGTVKDEKGPVAGARVFAGLEDQLSGSRPLMTLTDANGAYSLTSVPPGKYKVLAADQGDTRFMKPGFNEEYEEAAESLEFHAGDKLTRDLKMYAPAGK